MTNWAVGFSSSFRDESRVDVVEPYTTAIVTPGASTNTKGSWYELCASLPFDCQAIQLWDAGYEIPQDYLYDIGIGASGSETVLVPNVYFTPMRPGHSIWPIALPAGTRIAARAQANTATALYLTARPLSTNPFGNFGFSRFQQGGADTSSSQLLLVDSGGTANTKGSWVQAIASANFPVKGFMVRRMHTRTPSEAVGSLLDIGVGGSGSETTVVKELGHGHVDNYDPAQGTTDLPAPVSFLCDFAPGTRFAMRAQASTATAGDRNVHAQLILMG